jgi:succinate dehydrogenase / fumarate reductase cytochrome b subunit
VTVTTRSTIRSSVGLKALVAASGIVLILFLVAHALGNLKVFAGRAAFDHYAEWLRTIGTPLLPPVGYLWLQRAVLLVAVLTHVGAATVLALRARAARPVRYVRRGPVRGSYAARTMRWGGVIIALFVVYHVLDLTTGTLNPAADPADPYGNLVADFADDRWYVTLLYTVAVVTLGFHLRHGVFSALRSLGQQRPRGERRLRALALGFAVALCAGYLIVPFAVLTGVVR